MDYIFTGMKHCGKSTMGKAWAEHIECPFYDTDEMVMDLYKARGGTSVSIRELYIKHGREYLKELEKEIMDRLNTELLPKSDKNVVSLGGGLPVNIDLILLLQDIGVVVYLEDSCEALFERVMASGNVPFLDKNNPREDFEKIYYERTGYYMLHANLVVDLENLSIENAKARVIETLKNKDIEIQGEK